MREFVLTDTNIQLRSADPAHVMHNDAVSAIEQIRRNGDIPCIVPQIIIEFRAVCTRPQNVNGLGMDQLRVQNEIMLLKKVFPLFNDTPERFAEWERIVEMYGSEGKHNHDARLVAAMSIHGISTILTFNKSDFLRYKGFTVVEPKDLL